MIDRIDKRLEGETSSWIDSPPVPAEPSGPLHGNPPFADEGVMRGLEDGEIASLAEGRPPAPWIAWRHPLKTLGGGLEKAVRPAAEKLGMTRTKERNGILILVDPSHRTFLVWGDTAIHERVEAGFWKDVAAAIEARLREGDFTGGLVHGIETAGRALAAHFAAVLGGSTPSA